MHGNTKIKFLLLSCAFVMKSGNLNFLEPSGPLQVCNGTDLPLQHCTLMVFVVRQAKYPHLIFSPYFKVDTETSAWLLTASEDG